MGRFITSLLLAIPLIAFADGDFFVKELVFPQNADSVTKIEMASRLVPDSRQLAWQDLELTAFLHFGINTFTDREWGTGEESPSLFNPDGLDADQWVKTLKDAGFRMVILTAKHHDGFCLWPTLTTPHSVAASPWRDGKGDVVADLSEACRRHGIKLGLYLSPWDRNAPSYGDSPRYNDLFVEQLTELLSNYGKVDEVWFDGACGEGPNGKKQEYDWARFRETITRLQPEAVLAIMGDDVRWVGNERGLGRETEWSATALTPGILPGSDDANARLGIFAMAPDLGGREIVAKADRLYWYPSEVDVSIRPGWFWHPDESPKSLRQLADIYLTSVGRNSVLLLNIPPDRSGKISASDSTRIMELRRWIDRNFRPVSLPAKVNAVVLREDISKGQRVERFTVSALSGGQWTSVAEGTTIGHKRILTFDAVDADSLRLDIISSRSEPNIMPVEACFITMPAENTATDNTIIGLASLPRTSDGSFVFYVGKQAPFSGIVYSPDPETDGGLVTKYRLFASNDALNWTEVPASGEFSNIENNPIPQTVMTPEISQNTPRYLMLSPVETVGSPVSISVSVIP